MGTETGSKKDHVKFAVQMFNFIAGGDWEKVKSQADVTAILETLAAAGYEGVEWCNFQFIPPTDAEGKPAWELAKIKADMDRLGLQTCGLHYHYMGGDVEETVKEALERCQALDCKRMIFAFSTPEMFGEKPDEKGNYTPEQVDHWVEQVNAILRTMKEILKDTGVKLLYHNHALELLKGTNGKYALDQFETDEKEVDVYWTSKGLGGSVDAALEYVDAHAGEISLLHMKDGLAGSSHTGEMCGWGKGTFPLQKILDKAKEYPNIEWAIVENDNPGSFGLSGLEDAVQSAQYAKKNIDFACGTNN